MSNAMNNESILDAMPVEMLPCMMAFLQIKDLPTFYSVCVMRKSSLETTRVLKVFEAALKERADQSILEYAPPVIKILWKTEFDKWCGATARNKFANISTLCILLKYLEMTETLSCEELEGNRQKQQFSWPIQIGSRVGAQQEVERPSEAIFSTPYFDTRLIVTSESWLSPEAHLAPRFPINGPALMNPDTNLGVLSWSDGGLLKRAHTQFDISAGMQVYWIHNNAKLVWMSKASREIFPGTEDLVKDSDKTSWLLRSMKDYDNNMLCYWEEKEGYANISVSDDEALEHIKRLVQSLDKHPLFQ